MQVLFIGEDFTTAADRQRDWETAGGVQPIVEQILLGQGLQIGICLVCHTIAISPKILKGLGTLLVLQLRDEDPRAIQNLLGTTPLQTEKITMLQRGELVALVPSVPRPVYARFEPMSLPRELTEAEREATARAFLNTVKAVKAAPPVPAESSRTTERAEKTAPQSESQSPAIPRISSRQVQILVLAGTEKPMTATKLCERLRIHRVEWTREIGGLETLGLGLRHSFSTGHPGGRVVITEVTGSGREELNRRGIECPAPVTGGGWEHNMAAVLIGDAGAQKGMKVSYEVGLQGVRADMEWRDPTGKRIFFNIGVSDPVREAENALKILGLPVMADNEFIFVARDSAFAKVFARALKAADSSGAAEKKIKVQLIADYLTE